ncbi:hypothetical protein [Tengunoibacter tsumagoiensis]|uniref:Uncharacterized protein n=1 Tax=Tengunoibacter tsumagoiensis TaxID=2014871 RepID=A0A401ZYW5_9CHLR|nr:hypothetical protein [Tengunoibacter tsumagoiensis]GCE12023.1 hypothetical protein KTT_18820 [Tengunoibacter tsumagoiensis]
MNYTNGLWGEKILGGPAYPFSEFQGIWKNERPLPYHYLHLAYTPTSPVSLERYRAFKENRVDLDQLRPEIFPVIDDFEVIMSAAIYYELQKEEELEFEASFFSPSLGSLGGLEYYEKSTRYTSEVLSRPDFLVPYGHIDVPYFELDQELAFMIVEWERYIYILGGSFEDVGTRGYDTWFKVQSDRYFSQWEQARNLARDYEKRKKAFFKSQRLS